MLTTRTTYFLKRKEIKTHYVTDNPSNIVATGRFTISSNHLYYSFYMSAHARRPRYIQFIDELGYIREEIPVVLKALPSAYQNATGKVCGVWHRVPLVYRKMLRDERMFVVVLWEDRQSAKLALAGKIFRMPDATRPEQFTVLLEASSEAGAQQMMGAGGTAIVWTSGGGANSTVHLRLVLNGLLHVDQQATDVPLSIRFESPERNGSIVGGSVLVANVNDDYSVIDFSAAVSPEQLRLLSRATTNLIVESQRRPNLMRIQGRIRTRANCEIFQAVFAPEPKTRATGLAWMFVDWNGTLVYNVRWCGASAQAISPDRLTIALGDGSGQPNFKLRDMPLASSDGRAFGHAILWPRIIQRLYDNDFRLIIGSRNARTAVRGRLIGRPVANSLDAIEPIILRRMGAPNATHLAGMAWVSIDHECSVYYEITLSGYDARQPLQLHYEEKPNDAPNAPTQKRRLAELNGSYTDGFIRELSTSKLIRMTRIVCNLQVRAKNGRQLLLQGKIRSFKLPSYCLQRKNAVNMQSDAAGPQIISMGSKCFHDERFYDEGDHWQSRTLECSMCSCVSGHEKCDKIECPPLRCTETEIRPAREGECCPACTCKCLGFLTK